MAYAGKKVHELRAMCMERELPKEGVKNKLISQLERYDFEKVNVKRESMEIDCMDPALISAVSTETGSSQETSTRNTIQPTPQSVLPEAPSPPESLQSTEDSEEALESVDDEFLEQQRDQSEVTSSLPASATTSPIIHHAAIEMLAPNSQQQCQTASSFETPPSSTRQPMLYDSSCQSSVPNEIDRELFARLITERKQLCKMQSPNVNRSYNRGITINHQTRNGVQYNYDLLLNIVQNSWVYNDGEIPLWLKEAYDATFGTSYWETSVINPGINADEIFLLRDDIQVAPTEYIFLS